MESRNIILPTIDFSSQELKPGTSTWKSVKAEVRTALEEFGCFHALYNKIPTEIRDKLFDSLPQLFDLPLEDKARNKGSKPYGGYIGPDVGREIFESLGIEDATSPAKVDSFTNTIWSQGNSNFSKTINSYIEPLSELDRIIRTMVLESLGLEKYKDEQMDSVEPIFRFQKYTAPNTDGTEVGLPSHTDKNILSILDQYGIKGLEVLPKDGDDDQWIPVNFSPNSLFVITGESFHAWTNGILHPPHHRVIMTGNESRYIVAFFSCYKAGYIVKVPEDLVDEDHPQLYNPFDFEGLLTFFKEAGYKYRCTVKAYCGI